MLQLLAIAHCSCVSRWWFTVKEISWIRNRPQATRNMTNFIMMDPVIVRHSQAKAIQATHATNCNDQQ
jgi:hypothetical protein